jgi:hypothetical protein
MVVSNTHILGIAAGVFVLASSCQVQANSIVLSQNPYSYSVGGEFSLAASDNFIANYAPVATFNGEFETFCAETEIYVQPGLSYTYNLSQQDSLGRYLTQGAAFLYYEFATGQLAGYDYATPAARDINGGHLQPSSLRPMVGPSSLAARQFDAGELQVAIWAFQGNQSDPGYGFPSLATDPFYQLALDTLGADAANSPDNGQYGVQILQLWDGDIAGQNQLVYDPIPIPDSASTGGMLALAFVGLVFLVPGRSFLARRPTAGSR